MQTMSSNTPGSGPENFFKWLPIVLGFGALFWFWGTISEFVVNTLENTLESIVLGAILVAIVGFVWSNPKWLYMTYTNGCRWLTGQFIKMDPLSYMDRFADILSDKLRNLREAIVNLKGSKVELERQIAADEKVMKDNLGWAQAAVKLGNSTRAAAFAGEAKNAKDSITLYTPTINRINNSLKFMEPMAENWELSIESMRKLIERKRRDWKILKKNAAALKQSEEFLRGDTEEARIYQESIKALEEQVSQKIAYIDDFEQRAKPILEGAAIQKIAGEQDSLKLLEDYMRGDKLFLPTFTDVEVVSSKVNATPITGSSKFKLLSK